MISYLLTFDMNGMTRNNFVSKIDAVKEIDNWMLFFDNTACIVSSLSVKELTSLIIDELPSLNFILVELSPQNRGGWLKRSVWNFIREPKPIDA